MLKKIPFIKLELAKQSNHHHNYTEKWVVDLLAAHFFFDWVITNKSKIPAFDVLILKIHKNSVICGRMIKEIS